MDIMWKGNKIKYINNAEDVKKCIPEDEENMENCQKNITKFIFFTCNKIKFSFFSCSNFQHRDSNLI